MVPVSEFSYLDHRSNFFYRRLWIELHRVLRRGSFASASGRVGTEGERRCSRAGVKILNSLNMRGESRKRR